MIKNQSFLLFGNFAIGLRYFIWNNRRLPRCRPPRRYSGSAPRPTVPFLTNLIQNSRTAPDTPPTRGRTPALRLPSPDTAIPLPHTNQGPLREVARNPGMHSVREPPDTASAKPFPFPAILRKLRFHRPAPRKTDSDPASVLPPRRTLRAPFVTVSHAPAPAASSVTILLRFIGAIPMHK